MIINPNNSVLFEIEIELTQQWPLLGCLWSNVVVSQFDDSSVVVSAVAVVLAEMVSVAEIATVEGFTVDSICSGEENWVVISFICF